jgi:hypothetical protein
MRKLSYMLLLLALFSCKQKPLSKSDYMHRALESDDYKIVLSNVKRVKDSLEVLKKRPVDTNAVIYEYNTIIPSSIMDVKTLSQVEIGMKKDTDFLKSAQTYIANKMAKDHQDSISKVKP